MIENIFKSNGAIESVVGIGINVNQQDFDALPKASSIYNILGKPVAKDKLLTEILHEITETFTQYKNNGSEPFWAYFHEHLYRINTLSLFVDERTQNQFKAVVKQVTRNGLLVLELENKTLRYCSLKEVTLVY
ncbi:hypothetical protein K5I29_02605 [Flavobacterium agricola]|uniref:Uncharacterized protein n=1 Tax=Flavobacterium agricola TaxID=2870839 RepID=A0ABY6M391_9FLAO|nr:hypothetical protein [Flavobacterium agricola]UYW01828.1 hypothetical protein K5I29_02605 [Flavobacterium agricola]